MKTILKSRTVGAHVVTLEDGGICHLTVHGEIELDEAKLLCDTLFEWCPPPAPLYILSDSTSSSSATDEASAFMREFVRANPRHLYVATYGASFRTRSMTNVLLGALRLIGRPIHGTMERTEADARKFLAQRRREHEKSAPPRAATEPTPAARAES